MDSASPSPIVTAKDRGVLVITLNRPAALNAWTIEMENRYFDELRAADADPGIRAIVLTGAGRGFCAGADMADLARAPGATDAEIQGRRPASEPLQTRKPLIAAINGPTAGMGLVQALFCDVRFASERAFFLTSFVRRGLVAEYGITHLLPRIVGTSRAADLLLSGRRVAADEALRIGLVDHVVPAEELLDAAVAYAADLAENCSPFSMALIKQQLLADADADFGSACERADRFMALSFASPDIAEGVASFTERRAPRFQPLAAREDETWSSN